MNTITNIPDRQRAFFRTGATRSVSFRLERIAALKRLILEHEEDVYRALKQDLGKSEPESYLAEVVPLIKEIDFVSTHLHKWASPKRVRTPITHRPASSIVCCEPLGVVLIIGTWNYPFQLILAPLIPALAAGNCAVLKPSEAAPATSALVTKLIGEYFDPTVVSVFEGGPETAQKLLKFRFDHIFFTGGPKVGRIVARAAAEHLTPVTLELGGKSPCLVDRDANLSTAAKRIAWGKFFNAGQSCAAPDYVLVHREARKALTDFLADHVRGFYGEDPQQSPDYARIVNAAHFERLKSLLDSVDERHIVTGGGTDPEDRYIAPTIIADIGWDHKLMEDEIFGPILPILEYSSLDEAIERVNGLPAPLSFYVFTRSGRTADKILASTVSGGCTVNDTVLHVSSPSLPFGGVGESGMGRYHGQAGFETFSNRRSVLKRSFFMDFPLRYPPYGRNMVLIKKLLNYFG